MSREAHGRFEQGDGLTAAPRVPVGIGFGKDRVASTSAIVDTGADVCVFAKELFPWPLSGVRSTGVFLRTVGGDEQPATICYPAITVGTIRLTGVASAILAGAEALLGRSFLNRCEVALSARRNVVLLREST